MSPAAICCGTAPSFWMTRPGESPDAHFQALEIVDRIDLLAEPATHLASGIAGEQRHAIIFLVELVERFLAATQGEPALVQPLVGAERNRCAHAERWVLAEIVVRGGM